ncbi:MAG: RecQ family ATP-dependent DNA helicase [Anaerolineae bacterium]|nr:RecQ family ATP-dependent DNA helicase [Anaerolineae bacterium]
MRQQAEAWLRQVLGAGAAFRDGQWEAIEALVVKRQRALVVQRTGWGKSMVYFLATRLLRKEGAGTTILISPLLALMRNQIQSAHAWGITAETINSSNPDDHARIEADLLAGKIDLLLISPERLANDRFQRTVWPKLSRKVGLLVIDEAHCISDWGHDFRPNYRRIMHILNDLPRGTPILGTTATANDRVVADVSAILGATMNIQRGSLTRESLRLYVYPDPHDHAFRLTLLTHLLKNIHGSGIIYCTTTRDCRLVAEWLQSQGLDVRAYYADVEESSDDSREALEGMLLNNQIKALVASVALGMGFDKADLHFVIHYQQPGNIIGYYQQIGRAGRGIEQAHIILMHGAGDEDIQRHFIETAFPNPAQVEATIQALASLGTATRNSLQRWVNANQSTLEKILTHLEVEKIIQKTDDGYELIDRDARPDYERWKLVTQQRYDEMEQMKAYINYEGCLMRFLADALDDPTNAQPCGQCKNCRKSQSKFQPNPRDIEAARAFLRQGKPLMLEPRKLWPTGYPGVKRSKIPYVNAEGIALCSYYDAGWAELVKQGRFQTHRYVDELVEASVELLHQHFLSLPTSPVWVTAVPSLRRPNLVPDFAQRLAKALNLEFRMVVRHQQQHPEQNAMRNSYQQAVNVMNAFAVETEPMSKPVLLVDDVAESKWTLSTVGYLLRENGSGEVYPFVLAYAGMG